MKRLRLYFSQNRYDPNNRVIAHRIKDPNTADFIRNNPTTGIVMESIHTGNKRVFTYVSHGNIFGEERYVYINKNLSVRLYVTVML